MKLHLNSLDQLPEIAKKLVEYGKAYKIWEFDGEMGAGKTTLIKAICKEMGVEENVSSPTFSIVNEYVTYNKDSIYHFDFYRIKDEDEAFDMGVEEYFDSENYCFLEWAELIPSYVPVQRLLIKIEILPTSERIISVKLM